MSRHPREHSGKDPQPGAHAGWIISISPGDFGMETQNYLLHNLWSDGEGFPMGLIQEVSLDKEEFHWNLEQANSNRKGKKSP